MRRLVLVLAFGLLLAGCASNNATTPTPAASGKCTSTLDATKSAKEPVVSLNTTQGTIRLTLFCDKAPVTTQNIVKLVEAGCYDGTKIHRVVRGFMDQGGDPRSKSGDPSTWGTGGPSDCGQSPDTIPEEYYCKDGTISQNTPSNSQQPTQCDEHGGLGLKHDAAGVWSMARTSAPHSSGSQFFLTAAAASFLDGRYTVFGHTADDASTQVVLKINNLPCNNQPCQDPNSRTTPLVTIEKATVEWG